MEYIQRSLEKVILKYLKTGKAIILSGARRTGKTVLLNRIRDLIGEECLFLNGEDFGVQEQFSRRTILNLEALMGTKRILILDEATSVPEIGKAVKLMIDTIPELRVILSGSSSFDLINKTGEPLTGRKHTLHLYPICDQELATKFNSLDMKEMIRQRVIFGNYPELFSLPGNQEKALYLRELANSYLLKDVLAFENLRNASKLRDLLRLLAYQIGNEVSLSELSRNLSITRPTVERYIDLLIKVFVIVKIEPFSRNLRKEITKSAKYYFLDNGIRNVLINNLEPLEFRNDTGQLWENLMVGERIKAQEYDQTLVSNHFWRTYDQQEIDWIEDRNGQLFAYDMKWNPERQKKCPVGFSNNYPEAEFHLVNPENYQEFINQE